MMAILFGLVSVFPVSFIVYAISERLIARHGSRVGKDVEFGKFVLQTWRDAWIQIKSIRSRQYWFIFAVQCSVVFLLDLNIQYLIFIYLALTGSVLVWFPNRDQNAVVSRIEADRTQVRYAVASVVAILCLLGCFAMAKNTSLALATFYFTNALFVIPFQLAGMILFGEHPFQGMSARAGYAQSALFYVWSMVCVKLFLGGGEYFIDFHLKVAAIYLAFRVCGIYFPKFQQRDLLRISVAYLFPITGLLWLSVVLMGALELGADHV